MIDKEYNDFAKAKLDAMRETLKAATYFTCACCQKQKVRGEAAGAHLYQTENSDLVKAMKAKNGMPKVATYVLCLECADSVSDKVMHTKVTAYLGKQGLFDPEK